MFQRLCWVLATPLCAAIALSVGCVGGGPTAQSPPPSVQNERVLRIPVSEIGTVLAKSVSEAPVVGFLPRLRFESLSFEAGDALQVSGEGRWFNVGAGAFVDPIVRLKAEIPMDPNAWEVRQGGVGVKAVRLLQANRMGADERPEREANRDGWEKAITQIFARATPLVRGSVDGGPWEVVSVERQASEVVVTVRR